MARHHTDSHAVAISFQSRFSRLARLMMLSSTSVTFETWCTSKPDHSR